MPTDCRQQSGRLSNAGSKWEFAQQCLAGQDATEQAEKRADIFRNNVCVPKQSRHWGNKKLVLAMHRCSALLQAEKRFGAGMSVRHVSGSLEG